MKNKEQWIYCRFYEGHNEDNPLFGWWVDTQITHDERLVYVVVNESDKEVVKRERIWIENHNKTAHKL